jgi:hypothetical protein
MLMCGAEIWAWTIAGISRLMAAYMRFLTGIEGKNEKRENMK